MAMISRCPIGLAQQRVQGLGQEALGVEAWKDDRDEPRNHLLSAVFRRCRRAGFAGQFQAAATRALARAGSVAADLEAPQAVVGATLAPLSAVGQRIALIRVEDASESAGVTEWNAVQVVRGHRLDGYVGQLLRP